MDPKQIEAFIEARDEGKSFTELSLKYDIPRSEIKKVLADNMGDRLYTFDIIYKTDNSERIQKIIQERILEILAEYHPDIQIPSTSQKFIKIHEGDLDCCIGLNIMATYYDTVVKSLWKYKKYHTQVKELIIILISRRISKDRLDELLRDKPENVTIIPYTETALLEKLRKKLMQKQAKK